MTTGSLTPYELDAQVRDLLVEAPSCRHSRINAAQVIQTPVEAVKGIPVQVLLLHCKHMGLQKLDRVLEKASLNGNTTIGELSEVQRKRLIEALRPFPPGEDLH